MPILDQSLPDYSAALINKAKKIKLLICDVDGVLSDGKIYFGNQDEEYKSFNVKDGLGITQLLNNGIQVAIITGRKSKIVERRATELSIRFVFQGKSDKQAAYLEAIDQLKIEKHQVAHIGDDLPDLPLMKQSGMGISVADGHPFVKQHADWITDNNGGNGAVREVCDLLLSAQQKLAKIHSGYLKI